MNKSMIRFAACIAAALALAGCGDKAGDGQQLVLSPAQSPFRNTDVTGLDYANSFA